MKAGKKKCGSCVNSFLKSDSSSRFYKNGNLVTGYDTTYDSDDNTLDIKTYGHLATIPNDEFIKNLLQRNSKSLSERLMSDFSVSLTPDNLYDAKNIGVSISPIISSKYHPLFTQGIMINNENTKNKNKSRRTKKTKKSKASRKNKK